MSASNRGFRGRNTAYLDRKSSDLPENIGNRRTFEELKIPPDNVGNKVERDTIATFVHDGLGNSLEEEPSHLRSGILTQLLGVRERPLAKRLIREPAPFKSMRPHTNLSRHEEAQASSQPARTNGHKQWPRSEETAKGGVDISKLSGEEYMAHLTNEFARLLRARAGVPFAFSMKPVTDTSIDENLELESLSTIEKLIIDILKATDIAASISFSQYRTAQHRFAVFFVAPSERDPIKNKDLISALRQIIKLHASQYSPGQVNVLLVLANAQHVIEEHLYKIGAKKIEE